VESSEGRIDQGTLAPLKLVDAENGSMHWIRKTNVQNLRYIPDDAQAK
jgi:hypothetical protein